MLRSLLALRLRPSPRAARALLIPSISALLHERTCFSSIRTPDGTKSTLDKFLKSVNLLDASVSKRDLAGLESLLQSMDKINSDSNDRDKNEVLSTLEAFCTRNESELKYLSVHVALTRRIAECYQQQLQRPELAVTSYLKALEALPSLSLERVGAGELLQVQLLSNVAQCYKKLGRDADAEEYFNKVIALHEQHRRQRGLSPTSGVDAVFHKRLGYEVLDSQLGFMETLLTAERWDDVRVLLERVVEQIEDSPSMTSSDKLAEIQVIINKGVEWLATTETPHPRVSFDVVRSPQSAEDFEQLLAKRRKLNRPCGLDLDDGVKLLERENALLDEFAEKQRQSNTSEEDALREATNAFARLKEVVPNSCGTCTMALMIASKHVEKARYSSALSYYLEGVEVLTKSPAEQIAREWNMAWVERQVLYVGALCEVASCYQKLYVTGPTDCFRSLVFYADAVLPCRNDIGKANVYYVKARDAHIAVCERVRSRGSNASVLVDDRALCPSTDDEERLLSGLALTIASTLVDYAENLTAEKDWTKVKAATDHALELAQGCTISLNHIKARVERILAD